MFIHLRSSIRADAKPEFEVKIPITSMAVFPWQHMNIVKYIDKDSKSGYISYHANEATFIHAGVEYEFMIVHQGDAVPET